MKEHGNILNSAELQITIQAAVESIISRLKSITSLEQQEVMNIKQASEFLGLSQSTLYTYISKRTIPYVKRNGAVWFLRSKLMEWLEEGQKKTINTLSK